MKKHYPSLTALLFAALFLISLKSYAQDVTLNSYNGQPVITTYNGVIHLTNGFHVSAGQTVHIFISPGNPPVGNVASNLSAANNYIASWTATAPEQNPNNLITRPLRDAKLTVQYFDGLGRPLQTIAKQGSLETATGASKDLVTPIVYDEFGRESTKYLPYASGTGSSDGSYKPTATTDQVNFYNNTPILSGQGENGANAQSQIVYEASPLDRVLKTMAPGNSWVGNGVGVGQGYWTNTAADNVQYWQISFVSTPGSGFGTYTQPTPYQQGQLYKTVTTDEAGHQVIEFKDKEGHVVLKKAQNTANADDGSGQGYTGWLCTYYLYDDLGNLRCMIQPKGVELLANNGWNLTDPTILTEQCFRYEYDQRKRMVIKQVPGAGMEYMVYDARDREVATQDAQMRNNNNQWLVTQYDNLNRPVRTGTYNDGNSFTFLLNAAYNNAASYPDAGAYPGSPIQVLTETHYDTYTGLPSGLSATYMNNWDGNFAQTDNSNFPYPQLPTQNSSISTTGLVTWTGRTVINPQNNATSYLATVNIYDDKSRVIQTQSQNTNGGINVATTQYSWVGQPLVTVLKTENPTATNRTLTVVSRTTYDDLGRIIKTETKQSNTNVNSGNMTNYATTAEMQYDALGQLAYKKIGNQRDINSNYTGTPLETQTFDYNIRGWLLGMNRAYARSGNSPAAPGLATQSTTLGGEMFTDANQTVTYLNTNYFGFDLGYDQKANNLVNGQTYTKAQLNGNITGMVWKSAHDGMVRKYDFDYDPLNRFKSGDFNQYSGSTFDKSANVNYSVTNLNYDANGNIMSMRQNGLKTDGTSPLIDQLGYTYLPNSNKLQQVVDTANDNTSTLGDFKYDPNTKTTTDYTYDANGNLTSDKNKGITNISYNYLNLPQTITIPGKGTIDFAYDANGVQLQKKTVDLVANKQTLTTYLGNGVIYQNTSPIGSNQIGADTLQFFDIGEGRGRISATNNFVYDYYLRDHLGNSRILLTDDYNTPSPILEATSYAPFGLMQKGIGLQQTGSLHNWKKTFQKQEFNEDLGIDYYEYKYRFHDPQTGRFLQIDPLAEDYPYNSTYAFSENKLTGHVELEGLEGWTFQEVWQQTEQAAAQAGPAGEAVVAGGAIVAGIVGLFNIVKYAVDNGGTNNSMTLIPQSTNQAMIDYYAKINNLKPQPASIKPQAVTSTQASNTTVQMAAKKGPKDLVGEAKAQKEKEMAAAARATQRQAQTTKGMAKQGNSNQGTKGSHNSGSKSNSDKQRHDKAEARRAREQKAAENKKQNQ